MFLGKSKKWPQIRTFKALTTSYHLAGQLQSGEFVVWSPTDSLLEFPFKGPQPAPPLCLQRLENVFIAISITFLCQEALGCCNSSTSRSDGVKNFMPASPRKRTRSAEVKSGLWTRRRFCVKEAESGSHLGNISSHHGSGCSKTETWLSCSASSWPLGAWQVTQEPGNPPWWACPLSYTWVRQH